MSIFVSLYCGLYRIYQLGIAVNQFGLTGLPINLTLHVSFFICVSIAHHCNVANAMQCCKCLPELDATLCATIAIEIIDKSTGPVLMPQNIGSPQRPLASLCVSAPTKHGNHAMRQTDRRILPELLVGRRGCMISLPVLMQRHTADVSGTPPM